MARWPKHSLRFAFCPPGAPSFRRRRRRNPVKISFAKKHFHRGSQIVLAAIRLRRAARTLRATSYDVAQNSPYDFSPFNHWRILWRRRLRFRFAHFPACPSGLLELRSSQGLKPAVFATLSPVLIELTSSVLTWLR